MGQKSYCSFCFYRLFVILFLIFTPCIVLVARELGGNKELFNHEKNLIKESPQPLVKINKEELLPAELRNERCDTKKPELSVARRQPQKKPVKKPIPVKNIPKKEGAVWGKDVKPVVPPVKQSTPVAQKESVAANVPGKIAPPERVVTVCHKITEDMTTYKRHWSGKHITPSKFVVSVNDQELKHGIGEKIKIIDDTLKIRYDYVFSVAGVKYRSGGKVLEFKVPADVENIEPTFSWDTPPHHIALDKAEYLSSYDVS